MNCTSCSKGSRPDAESIGGGRKGVVQESLFEEVTFTLTSLHGWGRAAYLRQHKECKERGKSSHPNDSQNKVKIPQPYYSTVIANMWCWLAPRERGKRSGNSSPQCLPSVKMCAPACVCSSSFVFPLPCLPNAISCLTWVPQLHQAVALIQRNKGEGCHSNRGHGE